MTDEEALRAAVRESPHEDTPRLIYADWCEENDRGLYAEFVRAQVELARLPQVRTHNLLWRAGSKIGHVLQFKTQKSFKSGEEIDLFYDSGRNHTVLILDVESVNDGGPPYKVDARILRGGHLYNEPHAHRRGLRERVRQLWREGDVVRHAIPESMSVRDVGLEYKRDNNGVVERGMLGTLIVGELDAEDVYNDVSRAFPITRIILTGDWSIDVRERVRLGCLPSDVQLDMRWRSNDGRAMFVSEMKNGHLLNALTIVTRSPNWRQDVRYVLEREAERRKLVSKTGVVAE